MIFCDEIGNLCFLLPIFACGIYSLEASIAMM